MLQVSCVQCCDVRSDLAVKKKNNDKKKETKDKKKPRKYKQANYI